MPIALQYMNVELYIRCMRLITNPTYSDKNITENMAAIDNNISDRRFSLHIRVCTSKFRRQM